MIQGRSLLSEISELARQDTPLQREVNGTYFPKADWKIKEEDGKTLIVPSKSKWEWTPEERLFRSMLIDAEGRPLSVGMPKFGNWGEPSFEDHAEVLENELAKGTVFATEKFDGSLIIRSVIDGRVHLRTRGAHGLGSFHGRVSAVAENKYPRLMDPTWMPEHSLHLEFISCSPEFQIVIRYGDDDLRFIGGISHNSLQMLNQDEIAEVSIEGGLVRVTSLELPSSMDKLVEQIRALNDKEGVVLSCAQGQIMVKVKSEQYLAIHKIRSHMNAKHVFEIFEEHEFADLDAFKQHLADVGADWELFSETAPYVEAYLKVQDDTAQRVSRIKNLVAQMSHLDAKAFATEFATKLQPVDKSIAFMLRNDKEDQAIELARKSLRAQALEQFKNQASVEDAELQDS